MLHLFNPLLKTGAFVLAALLTVSSASAQPSALGHVAAPGYRPRYTPGASALRVYPGDKGFHSTMQIERYYQMRERVRSSASFAPLATPHYTATTAVSAATPNVIVSIGEPASKQPLVDIRGPDGKIRSFPVAGGKEVIRPRTIVLHPGDSLTIQFAGARAEAPKKP
jgi:hypothetical protein